MLTQIIALIFIGILSSFLWGGFFKFVLQWLSDGVLSYWSCVKMLGTSFAISTLILSPFTPDSFSTGTMLVSQIVVGFCEYFSIALLLKTKDGRPIEAGAAFLSILLQVAVGWLIFLAVTKLY